MQNLLTSNQIRDADAHIISTKTISSIELMEAASLAFVEEFKKEVSDKKIPISIYCGTGNNGGDGLAVARILETDSYENITVKIIRFSNKSTPDFNTNLDRLKLTGVAINELYDISLISEEKSDILIDAILGSGLNKPITGELKDLIDQLNSFGKKIISIDVPSGFPAEGIIPSNATFIKASLVISFQRPKINFIFPESGVAIQRFTVIPIGLDELHIESLSSYWKLLEERDICQILKPRKRFSHKGTYGHALIIAGSKKTMGAALLCVDACLHSGAGLTSACIPESGMTALNISSPEVMALVRANNIPSSTFTKHTAVAIGPGLGADAESIEFLQKLFDSYRSPIVLDADALNMLAKKPDFLKQVPPLSILTPHMKEFDRMFGEHSSWWQRVETARKKSAEFNIIILLKNQYSFIVLPDGNVLINTTGNPAMAVGGMGDVLTGMIVSFLAQGYRPEEAAMISCFLHGKAGDELRDEGMNSIPPRKLVERLPYIIDKTGKANPPPTPASGE